MDRSDTSHLLADYAITNFGLSSTKFVVASGDANFGGADALAAGPFAASLDAAPLLVTDSVTDAGQVVTFGAEHESTETTGYAVGGPDPLPAATLAPITAAASGASTVGAYTVSPSTSVNLNISGGATENETYTVTGIPSGTNARRRALHLRQRERVGRRSDVQQQHEPRCIRQRRRAREHG